MTNKNISGLTAAATPLAGTELVPVWDGAATKKVAVSDLTAGRNVSMVNLTATGTELLGTPALDVGLLTRTILAQGGYASANGVRQQSLFTIAGLGAGYCAPDPFNDTAAGNDRNWHFGTITYGSYYQTPDFIWVNTGVIKLKLTNGGDLQLPLGNLVQGTAAKGINFTANTPAAGMTSQLLNWYEEGTWTPTITAGSGTFTTVSGTGTYTRTGRTVYIDFNILITANGTAAGYVKVAGLPWTASAYRGFGTGQETDAVGFEIAAQVIGGTNFFYIQKVDLTYPGGTSYRLQGSLTYKV